MPLHHDGRRFRNPGAPDKTLRDVMRWLRTRTPAPWPKQVENLGRPQLASGLSRASAALTFIGHSTFLVQLPALNLLTDPVYAERASPVRWAGPRRVRAPALALAALPPIHVVLVSHNHYDHMDVATLRELDRRHRPLFVTTLGNRAYLRGKGLARVEELDWWGSLTVGEATVATLTPAVHFSARWPHDRNRTLWGGFVVASEAFRLFFAADSGYGAHFREIRERLGVIDLALLPIGAYEPRWFMGTHHMNPEEAVRAHVDLGRPASVAMHFGTFQLTDEPIDAPPRALACALTAAGIDAREFRVLEFGETRRFVAGDSVGA